MKNELNLTKKVFKHLVYLSIKGIIDLSEWIYYKLNDIKFDFKYKLEHLFDEKDNSTNSNLIESYTNNKSVKKIILWFASLFGALEYEIEEMTNIRKKQENYFINTFVLQKTKNWNTFYFVSVLLNLLLLRLMIDFTFT